MSTKIDKISNSPQKTIFSRRREREQLELTARKQDGERIRELREALHLTQEAFAKECGVGRIAAVLWESGKTRPTSQGWRQMAKLAGKVAPSTAPWFWEKAGFDRDALEDLLPELERLSKESQKRVRKLAEGQGSNFSRVPLLRPPMNLEKTLIVSPEEIETWIPLPKDLIPVKAGVFALRVSPLFVWPVFTPGDIVVIDPSEKDLLKLEGELAAAIFIPDAETKRTSNLMRRGQPVADYMKGSWPHLMEGIYLGWLVSDTPVTETRVRQLSLNSTKRSSPQSIHTAREFSVPVASFDEDLPKGSQMSVHSEASILGRVILWISTPKTGDYLPGSLRG